MTTPLFKAIRQCRPTSSLVLYCHPRMAPLALACRLADRLESIDEVAVSALFVPGAWRMGELGGLVQPGDEVVSYISDPDGVVLENLAGAGAASVGCGGPLVAQGHAADWMVRPLEALAIPVKLPVVPRLRLPADLVEEGRRQLTRLAGQPEGGGVIVIHPGSGSARKNWPAAWFVALARRLRDECGIQSVFTFGEADSGVKAELVDALREFAAVSGRDLLALAALVAACRCYIGNDSGITHLAAALDVPTVAMFGPTDPAIWGPRGSRVAIMRAQGADP
ncbi:MAG: glycosyltransferase family 9 protein, partial [bacterium]